jgi:hypothetical protein
MLTQESVRRPWVNFEAGAAWLAKKVIIPICFRDLTPDQLPKPYSALQAVHLPDEAYYLLRSVAKHLGHSLPPPPVDGGRFRSLREKS